MKVIPLTIVIHLQVMTVFSDGPLMIVRSKCTYNYNFRKMFPGQLFKPLLVFSCKINFIKDMKHDINETNNIGFLNHRLFVLLLCQRSVNI